MSVSLDSYESIVQLACLYYDKNMALYYTEAHYRMVCDMLAIVLQKSELTIVRTNVKLCEPILDYHGVIYISVPLVAMLVNLSVKLPKNNVQFVDDFNVFAGLVATKNTEQNTKNCILQASRPLSMSGINNIHLIDAAPMLNANTHFPGCNTKLKNPLASGINEFTEHNQSLDILTSSELVRFTQILRLVMMCAHFQQHYCEKIPFTTHKHFKKLEIAKQTHTNNNDALNDIDSIFINSGLTPSENKLKNLLQGKHCGI